MAGPTPGPGLVATAGLVQSIPTREPNFDPRIETICFRMWHATISLCCGFE